MDNKQILNEVNNLLRYRCGDIIERIVLFGSRVNGSARDYSDYDMLIITRTDCDWRKKNEILFALYDVCVKNDLLIDAKIISVREMNGIRGKQPYIQSAIETGISI